MRASRPATRPSRAASHFIEADRDATRSGLIFLGRDNPANPLIARERRNIRPQRLRLSIRLNRPAKICWHCVRHIPLVYTFPIGCVLLSTKGACLSIGSSFAIWRSLTLGGLAVALRRTCRKTLLSGSRFARKRTLRVGPTTTLTRARVQALVCCAIFQTFKTPLFEVRGAMLPTH